MCRVFCWGGVYGSHQFYFYFLFVLGSFHIYRFQSVFLSSFYIRRGDKILVSLYIIPQFTSNNDCLFFPLSKLDSHSTVAPLPTGFTDLCACRYDSCTLPSHYDFVSVVVGLSCPYRHSDDFSLGVAITRNTQVPVCDLRPFWPTGKNVMSPRLTSSPSPTSYRIRDTDFSVLPCLMLSVVQFRDPRKGFGSPPRDLFARNAYESGPRRVIAPHVVHTDPHVSTAGRCRYGPDTDIAHMWGTCRQGVLRRRRDRSTQDLTPKTMTRYKWKLDRTGEGTVGIMTSTLNG